MRYINRLFSYFTYLPTCLLIRYVRDGRTDGRTDGEKQSLLFPSLRAGA